MYQSHLLAETPLACVLDTGVSALTPTWIPLLLPSAPSFVIKPDARPRIAAAEAVIQAALKSGESSDAALDQYYTAPEIARACLAEAADHLDLSASLLLEPSAGNGSFSKLMPPGHVAMDVEPRGSGIITADFLSVQIDCHSPIVTIGNPPFGRNSALAVRFFNRAAVFSSGIAFVVPRSFRKAAILRKLHRKFHLVREIELPPHAFLFRGKPFDVPAIFQVWKRRKVRRALPPVDIKHPDFDFTCRRDAEFVLQRVGTSAGRVHHNFDLKETSQYFIRPHTKGVEATMVALRGEFAAVASNTAGYPSLAKAEVIALYRERTEGVPAWWRGSESGTLPASIATE